MTVVLLGLAAGAVAGVLSFALALLRTPPAKARRVALAGAMGGAVAFTLTALVQLPFYGGSESRIGTALLIACAAGAAGTWMAADMILRTQNTNRDT